MLKAGVFIVQMVVAAVFVVADYRLLRKKIAQPNWGVFAALSLLAVLVSLSASVAARPGQTVTITALNEKNEAAKGSELTLACLEVNGKKVTPEPVSGQWVWYKGQYRWFPPGDKRLQKGMTDAITLRFDLGDRVEISFVGNTWKGLMKVELDGAEQIVDTYLEEQSTIHIPLPKMTTQQTLRAISTPTTVFLGAMLTCRLAAFLVVFAGIKLETLEQKKYGGNGPVGKLKKYRFLFEELVKRDFKKKYKRTVLGMAWSILSPLLTLLVMRLVFTQFFGRNTPYYTTYLFCGNLVYAYFSESTNQGMTALRGNAGIFTKVNVPKYLFLFSKNIQTLINFGLTLCIFFLFCVLDHITFTWKLICLIYPIIFLMLFNIGVGLILSALFIFFRDIQYLWSVATMLIMYMSAIFYNIEGYSPMVQNLFLLNPIYLFVRYFRKIVIETTIPTVWFHLLMLVDVVIVVGLGFWMYKKYNHKFLYYV